MHKIMSFCLVGRVCERHPWEDLTGDPDVYRQGVEEMDQGVHGMQISKHAMNLSGIFNTI